ncbi:hypothetical protein DXG01_007778 [Tephrocybe rancida]|nr:hypothetical protein DXG01_007778 [Tephrocybe rancida]
MDSGNLDLAQAMEKVVVATKAYNDVMYKKLKKMKGATKALEAANEGLHAAEVSAQKAKKRPSMGREPESGGLGPEPKHLHHTGGEESAVESELTEGGSLQMPVEVVHSALDGVLTPIPSDGEQDDTDISGGTNPLEQMKIINQQMLKQGDLFSLAMAAQTMGGDNGDVEAEQGGSKRDGRGNAADSDGSSSSNKDDVEMGKDNGGKKDGGDPPDKKNNSAEGSAANNGGVRKRNNAQDDFDILTQADRIRMKGDHMRNLGLSQVWNEVASRPQEVTSQGSKAHAGVFSHIQRIEPPHPGHYEGELSVCCGDLMETTILPKPMVPGARLVVNSQMEKVPTRVKGRKTFKKVLVECADLEEGCPVEDALFNFIIFKTQRVFDPTTTEFTSPKMTPPVHTLLHHTLRSIADLSLDDFYLGPKYFKDNIPLTTPFPRYFSYEYQLEITRKAIKGLLAQIRYLNHVLSEGEMQLEAEDIEIWQEELSKEKIAARMACKTAHKEKQVKDSSDEDGMEEK